MALEDYRRKRQFSKTPEPIGDAPQESGWRFVIQKHDATNLHYDLRLEMDGVLKSWAVPKGPSLNPADKRLAIHVEDHPIEYLHFEGIIPKGEYGGGTVMVWDTGTWQPLTEDGYEKGDLKFHLDGEKLQGKWMLVHTGKRKSDDKNRRQWLLFKERDAVARDATFNVLEAYSDSVLSGRSMEEIANSADRIWTAADTQRTKIENTRQTKTTRRPKATSDDPKTKAKRGGKPHPKATKGSMPKSVEVPVPTGFRKPPNTDEWLHEIKFDGYRMLAFVKPHEVRFVSRNNNDWTSKLQRLAGRLQQFGRRHCIFDGEVVHMAPDGTTSFQALQNTIGRGDDRVLSYCIFDLIYLDGYDLRKVPLEARRALLSEVMAENEDPALLYSEDLDAAGALVFEKAAQLGAEGIISKRKGSTYPIGRTDQWRKTKCVHTDEFVVGGYTPSTADPSALGALVVGRYNEEGLCFEGRVGTGFSADAQHRLLETLRAQVTDRSPFYNLTGRELKALRPVHPTMVVEVEYGGWTDTRRLRFPTYRGIREDRSAESIQQIVADTPSPAELAPETIAALEQTRLTHPDRVMYPDAGVTKLALVMYYAHVVDWILPHLAERPLALVRFPKGLGEQSFFQKSVPKGMSDSVSALEGSSKKALWIRDVAGLLTLIQFSALELHIWGSRTDRPDRPDRLVLDLDPDESVDFQRVKHAASEIRELLDHLGLVSFVMTTGGKGLHVTIPIRRTLPWPEAKKFTRTLVNLLAKHAPGRFTASSSKTARRGKIYLDYLRNTHGATAIAPYSTRARSTASVATPVSWEELEILASPSQFTIDNLPRRLATLQEDPWQECFTIKQNVTAAMLKQLESMVK